MKVLFHEVTVHTLPNFKCIRLVSVHSSFPRINIGVRIELFYVTRGDWFRGAHLRMFENKAEKVLFPRGKSSWPEYPHGPSTRVGEKNKNFRGQRINAHSSRYMTKLAWRSTKCLSPLGNSEVFSRTMVPRKTHGEGLDKPAFIAQYDYLFPPHKNAASATEKTISSISAKLTCIFSSKMFSRH